MQEDPVFRQFLERRRQFLEEWSRLVTEVDEVLRRLEQSEPTLADAALITGLREERHRLFQEYEEAADRFVDHILARRSEGRLGGS